MKRATVLISDDNKVLAKKLANERGWKLSHTYAIALSLGLERIENLKTTKP